MEERTLKIISILKGKSKIPEKSQRYNSKLDAIVDYMSDECDCPIENIKDLPLYKADQPFGKFATPCDICEI